MKSIDPTQEYESNGDEGFPDGKHVVISWEWFSGDTYRNKDGRPMTVIQKDGKVVGRLNFVMSDDKPGPPMSLTLQEMPLLVKAFQGDLTKLPAIPELNKPVQVGKYMEVIKELCQKIEVTIFCEGDWANQVKGMEVPPGNFSFILSDISPIDKKTGLPSCGINKRGDPYIFANFQIISGEGGAETPFAGCSFSEYMRFDIIKNENGEIDWRKTDVKQELTLSARRLGSLMAYTAPESFAGSDYPKVDEPEEFLHIWSGNLNDQETPIVLKGQRAQPESPPKPKKGAKIYLNNTQLSWSSLELSHVKFESKKGSGTRGIFIELLDLLAGEDSVKPGTYDLTKLGIKVAKTYIGPLRKEGKIKHGYVQELTDDEIDHIFKHVKSKKVKPKKVNKLYEKFLAASLGFEEELDEETPF